MNTTKYKSPRILGGSRLIDAIEADEMNKAAIRRSIKDMGIYVPNDMLYSLEADQLELILQYKDFRVVDLPTWTDERNFVTDSKGRSYMPTSELNDARYLKFRDAKILSQIKDYGAFKRVIITMDEETTEDRKERKIERILDTVDEKYHGAVKIIKRDYLSQIVELTLNKYEVSIRKYLAALMRNVSTTELHLPITIEEACDALFLDTTKGMIGIMEDLKSAGLYDTSRIYDGQAVKHQIHNYLFKFKQYDLINEMIFENIQSYMEDAYQITHSELTKVSTNPAAIFMLVLLNKEGISQIRSFLNKMMLKGLIEDQSEMITIYQAYKRFRSKDCVSSLLNLHIGNEDTKDEENIKESNEETINHDKKPEDISREIKKVIDPKISISQLFNYKRDEPLSEYYKYFTIKIMVANQELAFIVGSSEKQNKMLQLFLEHLRTGTKLNVIDPNTDTKIYYRPIRRGETINELITIIEIQEDEYLKLYDSYRISIGLPGEVYRHINNLDVSDQEVSYHLISPYTSEQRKSHSRYLRHNLFRLDATQERIDTYEHSIDTLEDLETIYDYVVDRFTTNEKTGETCVVHDIRSIFSNDKNMISLLEYDLEDALKKFAKYVISRSNRRIMKHELLRLISNYKTQYQMDKKKLHDLLLQDVEDGKIREEITLIKLRNFPRLKDEIRRKIYQMKDIMMIYCHTSTAIAGQPGAERIEPSWTKEKELLIDIFILDTFQHVRVLSAIPDDPYLSHGRVNLSEDLLNGLQNSWEEDLDPFVATEGIN